MKIKTIMKDDIEELDQAVNEYNERHNVVATHTDMIMRAGVLVHKATLFYKGGD